MLKKKMEQLFKPYLGLPKEIYVIFFARMINAMGIFVFPFLSLILTVKIGLTKPEAGFWVSLGGLLFIPASMIGGKLADTIGRKKLIIIFDTLAAFSYFSCSLIEPSMEMVYLLLLATTFMGIADPAHNSLIADLTTPDNRNGAYSLSYLGFNMGFAIGPFIGGMLFENHFKLFFIIDAFTAFIATILVFWFIDETFGKINQELGEDRKMEQRMEGSIFKVLLSRPILIFFALILFGYNFVYSQWGFLLPLHAEHNFQEQGAGLYGILASFNGFIVMVFTPIITLVFMKQKNIRRIVYGGILYIIGFGMLGFISTKVAFFISAFIFTLGEIMITISMMPFIANHTPASHRGRMNAVLPMIMGLGFTLGPVGMGNVLRFLSIEDAWKVVGLLMLISTMLMYLLEKIDGIYQKSKEVHGHEKEMVI